MRMKIVFVYILVLVTFRAVSKLREIGNVLEETRNGALLISEHLVAQNLFEYDYIVRTVAFLIGDYMHLREKNVHAWDYIKCRVGVEKSAISLQCALSENREGGSDYEWAFT